MFRVFRDSYVCEYFMHYERFYTAVYFTFPYQGYITSWCVFQIIFNYFNQISYLCNIIAEGFRFIYLAFGFSKAENLSAQCID